jgi:hypothetical protein
VCLEEEEIARSRQKLDESLEFVSNVAVLRGCLSEAENMVACYVEMTVALAGGLNSGEQTVMKPHCHDWHVRLQIGCHYPWQNDTVTARVDSFIRAVHNY